MIRASHPLFLGVLVGFLAPLACSEAQAPALPAIVAKDLNEAASQCSDVGGKPNTSKAVTRLDLNADGKEDYLFQVGMIQCEDAWSVYGDRAKGVSVYVGDGKGGAKPAYTAWVYGAEVKGTGPAAKLWVTVTAEMCGKPPAPDFASENFCDRALDWNPARQEFDYAPVSTVKMIE